VRGTAWRDQAPLRTAPVLPCGPATTQKTRRRNLACCVSPMADEGCRTIGLVSNTKIVNETRAWLQRNPDLRPKKVDWDNHGLIATLSGLVDWEDGSIEPLTPDDYATRLIDCEYDPAATCPIWVANRDRRKSNSRSVRLRWLKRPIRSHKS
jgi:phage/plasmid-associated DNA primase